MLLSACFQITLKRDYTFGQQTFEAGKSTMSELLEFGNTTLAQNTEVFFGALDELESGKWCVFFFFFFFFCSSLSHFAVDAGAAKLIFSLTNS
jgi:hypothetical protein